MRYLSGVLLLAVFAHASCADSFRIKASIDLPNNCFTQGFLWHKAQFFLSCGRYQHSVVYSLNAKGHIIEQQALPDKIFAEGISIYQKKLWLLSWKSGLTYPIDLHNLALHSPIKNSGQGWGLTTTDKGLVQSDGSSFLYSVSPNSHTLEKQQTHLIAGQYWQPLQKLNELEALPEFIAANVWQRSEIVFIALPLKKAQRIAFRLSLKKLARKHQHQGVLNGIAFDSKHQCLWVSGKMWPKAYALEINHPKLTLACTIAP